jgi:hypothetical protein
MFAKKQEEGIADISVSSSGSGGLEGATKETCITFIQTQPAGPAAAGSCVDDHGPSSNGQACRNNVEPTDPSSIIGKADIQNLTGVMFQILSRLDAQDSKIANMASLVENKISSPNMPVVGQQPIDMRPAQILTAQEACILHPNLQQFRNDSALVSQAHRHINQLEEDNLGKNSGFPNTVRSQKRGLARLGGENAPIIQVPWPHDFVLGVGDKRRLYYNALSWSQFLQGYTTIIEKRMIQSLGLWSHISNNG